MDWASCCNACFSPPCFRICSASFCNWSPACSSWPDLMASAASLPCGVDASAAASAASSPGETLESFAACFMALSIASSEESSPSVVFSFCSSPCFWLSLSFPALRFIASASLSRSGDAFLSLACNCAATVWSASACRATAACNAGSRGGPPPMPSAPCHASSASEISGAATTPQGARQADGRPTCRREILHVPHAFRQGQLLQWRQVLAGREIQRGVKAVVRPRPPVDPRRHVLAPRHRAEPWRSACRPRRLPASSRRPSGENGSPPRRKR